MRKKDTTIKTNPTSLLIRV